MRKAMESGSEVSAVRACPFCGNTEVKVRRIPRDGVNLFRDRYAVQCPYYNGGCGAEGGWRRTADEAVVSWNTRRRVRRD